MREGKRGKRGKRVRRVRRVREVRKGKGRSMLVGKKRQDQKGVLASLYIMRRIVADGPASSFPSTRATSKLVALTDASGAKTNS